MLSYVSFHYLAFGNLFSTAMRLNALDCMPSPDVRLCCGRVGTSKTGDLVNIREWVVTHVPSERPVVFALGAMAHGKVTLRPFNFNCNMWPTA